MYLLMYGVSVERPPSWLGRLWEALLRQRSPIMLNFVAVIARYRATPGIPFSDFVDYAS